MKKKRDGFSAGTACLLVLLPFLAAFLCLGVGRIPIGPDVIVRVLRGDAGIPQTVRMTVLNIRIPRIILALACGAGLSAAGCCFQALFSNPLATPDTMGVASGASFGAALGILLGLGVLGVQLTSFAAGVAAVAITWMSAYRRGRGPGYLILGGIMVGSLFSALVSLVKFVADEESQLPAITYWLMGSLSTSGYRNLAVGVPVIAAGLVVVFLIRWRMNLLVLSEDELTATGTNVRLLRAVVIICATAMTASVISMCGQVGWVCLIVPHMCRMRVGSNHRQLIPASVSIGAAFMVVVDTAARSLSAAEIPISILTAIIGAPFFIFLLRTSGRLGWGGGRE